VFWGLWGFCLHKERMAKVETKVETETEVEAETEVEVEDEVEAEAGNRIKNLFDI
jgi:hypothetical protein